MKCLILIVLDASMWGSAWSGLIPKGTGLFLLIPKGTKLFWLIPEGTGLFLLIPKGAGLFLLIPKGMWINCPKLQISFILGGVSKHYICRPWNASFWLIWMPSCGEYMIRANSERYGTFLANSERYEAFLASSQRFGIFLLIPKGTRLFLLIPNGMWINCPNLQIVGLFLRVWDFCFSGLIVC
jgi:hypothetical protein